MTMTWPIWRPSPRLHLSYTSKVLGMCYILSTTSYVRGGHKGGESPHYTLCQAQQGGHRGGDTPPYQGSGQCPGKFVLVLILQWADLPMVLCMGLHMVLGHDGFWPLVFCTSSQGNYGYVLIQG